MVLFAVQALFNGLAWAPWVPFMCATFKVVVVLVRPATYAIISRASSSNDQHGSYLAVLLSTAKVSVLYAHLYAG
uniref:Uncharacterized protein n=1 Tax=Quercus lobata TaxID=97700 RepID=A0A7N2R355_QUELO